MRKSIVLATSVAVLVGSKAISSDTYPRQPAIDAVHYRFQLTISETSKTIAGEATVTVRLMAPASEVVLDLVSHTASAGMTVTRVMFQGAPSQFAHHANRLRLPVPAGTREGQELTYTIAYGGTPANGLRFLTNLHGEPVVFSENWPDRARHWLPMIDHPYDKATGELIVTAPARYQVVSNGALVGEVDLANGERRTHWKQSVPIASWLYAVGIAPFDVHHAGTVQGVPLQTWVFPQNRAEGRTLFEETSRRALDFFSQRVGPYPYEKLANVQAAGDGGGMENATAIFYGEKGVVSGRAPVVHEIAHQWFGNSVTERDWDDVWLSEGFATYFTHLYTEQFEGRDAFAEDLKRTRATVLQLEHKLPDTPIRHRNLSDMDRLLNQLVYQKGGWVLHMLRAEVGTDIFWAAIREYYRRFRDGNASTDDLRQVFERASGKDLRWFFTQWLDRGGVPKIEGTWRYDARRKAVDVTLSQTQSAEPFRLNIEISIDGRTEKVLLDTVRKTFTLSADTVPAAVVIDTHTWLLADIGSVTRVN